MTYYEIQEILDDLPGAVLKPCTECPFLRTSTPGHIGPYTAEEWPQMCHAEGPIACHMTIPSGTAGTMSDWKLDGMKQCAGAAIFRANILKSPRHPNVAVHAADKQLVFAWDDEFIEHHNPRKEAHE